MQTMHADVWYGHHVLRVNYSVTTQTNYDHVFSLWIKSSVAVETETMIIMFWISGLNSKLWPYKRQLRSSCFECVDKVLKCDRTNVNITI